MLNYRHFPNFLSSKIHNSTYTCHIDLRKTALCPQGYWLSGNTYFYVAQLRFNMSKKVGNGHTPGVTHHPSLYNLKPQPKYAQPCTIKNALTSSNITLNLKFQMHVISQMYL